MKYPRCDKRFTLKVAVIVGYLINPAGKLFECSVKILRKLYRVKIQAIMMTDLRGFTQLSESLGPEQVMKMICEHRQNGDQGYCKQQGR